MQEHNFKCEGKVSKKSKLFNNVDIVLKDFRFMTIHDLVYLQKQNLFFIKICTTSKTKLLLSLWFSTLIFLRSKLCS